MDHYVEQAADGTLTCLEFTTYIEQINEKFALEIEIKWAIDCGGAVIGHVLSPETPVFELLGDVITQTLRLRNEAPPDVSWSLRRSRNTSTPVDSSSLQSPQVCQTCSGLS
jgi:hypothetical protein